MRWAVALVAAGVVAGFLLYSSVTKADEPISERFRYKWPWLPATGYTITTLPYQENHCCGSTCNNGGPGSCTDAYDFVIADDGVTSSDQGPIAESVTDVSGCGPNLHYGNYVVVENEFHLYDYVIYAHLNTVAQTEGTIYQGDPVGQQGETGNVIPCPGGKHLHFEFTPARPGVIDDRATDFTTKNPSPPLKSTNSQAAAIWGYLTLFPSIRQFYMDRGGWLWGWTHDVGRPGLSWPQGLYVHNFRTWGWEQTFAQEALWVGGIERGLYAPVWDQDSAQQITSMYWPFWNNGVLVGSEWRSIGLPVAEVDYCPPGSRGDCAGYQLFHLGYIWNDWNGIVQPVWCPDLGVDAWNKTKDGVADIRDVLAVLWYAFTVEGGGPNGNGAYYDPWYAAQGNTVINMLDVLAVLDGAIRRCYPS
jgi:hypothetical protein